MSQRGRRGMRESDKLADEALKMEAKLRALRSQMSKEREKWQSSRKANGGSMWKSGSADRGSIRNYHNDVRKRGAGSRRRGDGGSSASRRRSPRSGSTHRTPRDGDGSSRRTPRGGGGDAADAGATGQPVLRKKPPTDGASQRRRPRSARRLMSRADAASWTVPDVLRWLNVLSLSQYTQTFADNQINGEVLLELTTEDLDFMGINVLGHRKMLIKGVQTLQRAAAGEPPLSARRAPEFVSEDVALVYDNSENNNNVGTEVKGAKPSKLHWSEATPLSENTVQNADVPVNLADGMYDEAAQRAAFQAAVAEWRGSAPAAPAPAAATGGVNTDGMWTNPFAAAPAGGAGTGTGTAAGQASADADDGYDTKEEGGALLNGSLDEAAEHLAFERAVEAWRLGKDMPAVKGSCYECYKLFYKESSQFEDEGKSFCSASCQAKHADTQARIKQQQDEAASRRASLTADAEAARKAADQARSTSRLGTPMRVEAVDDAALAAALDEAHSSLAKVAPVQQVDNIWAMDLQF